MKRKIKLSRAIFFVILGTVAIITAMLGQGDKQYYILALICLALFSLMG